ncbi:MAG: cobalamin biosynthesis protein CobW [Proteobacteria bacterium]|nr:cobalamin biosynthesis protein CobW [Pseudomonadota bacterium]
MKIPATVVTGFLGAGKTTLIRHLLENAGGRRIALIVNEFGDLGIDAEILRGCGIENCDDDDVVELANGCICCTVADDFLPAMEKLLNRANPPEHIVIETSGLALPKPLVKAFNWPEVKSRVTVDGVITVVDGPAVLAGRFAADPVAVNAQRQADAMLDHDAPLEEVFEDQVLCADMIVLNKSDLLGDGGEAAVRAALGEHMNARTRVVTTTRGALDPLVALGLGMAVEDLIDGRRSHHDGEDGHDHDDFETFITDIPVLDDPAVLDERIANVARDHGVLRIKGFIAVNGKAMRHVVQAVGPRVERYYDRPWGLGEAVAGRLVVIGETGLDQAAIVAALRGMG